MNFYEQVYALVRAIPRGRVMTYGQIAGLISTGRAARAVGWAMRALPESTDVPWQRVIGRDGRITIVNAHAPKQLQVDLLRGESVVVIKKEGNFFVDLGQYQWHTE